MKAFNIITGFDGACPFSNKVVTAKRDGTFEVRPAWRTSPGLSEEDPSCGGSRFSIKVENLTDQDDKIWYVEWTEKFLKNAGKEVCPEESASWKNYVRDNFGSIGLPLEFPWIG